MSDAIRYRVTGMDCASCARKVENAVRSAGIADLNVSTTSQILTLNDPVDDERLAGVEAAVAIAGYHLDRLRQSSTDKFEGNVQHHRTPKYRRALWIVIGMNVGYGIIEMAGGFLSGSQALKADALDFLGDGLITLLGVFTIGWGLIWRARSALVQGVFLGALGIGVIGDTAWRLFSQQPVDAGLMGVVALVALVINVAAAVVMIPHRAGDANVRAVWLYSRNDAIGNAFVVLAAVLVAWTGTAWPDLVTAVAIAGLFLQSSWIIIRDAWREIANIHSEG